MGLREKVGKAIKRLPRTQVNDLVPEWAEDLAGEPLFLRALTGTERDEYESSRMVYRFDKKGQTERELNLANLRARLLVKCLVDESGQRIFKDSEAAELGQANGAVLDRLFEKAIELSGMDMDSEERLEKNLRREPGEDSLPGSPDTSDGAPCNGVLHASTQES